MPNKHATLKALFDDTANAIRAKTGGADPIVADNFPTEIQNISSKFFPNGVYWEPTNVTTGFFPEAIGYGNGLFVCNHYYSTDGKSWSPITSDQSLPFFNLIKFADGIWVAGSSGSSSLWYSEDGKVWYPSNKKDLTCKYVEYGNGIWNACFYNNGPDTPKNGLWYSKDGKQWLKNYNIPNFAQGQTWYAPKYANNMWVSQCSGRFYHSADGLSWTISDGVYGEARQIEYMNGVWVACTENGIAYSEDGISWALSNQQTFHEGWDRVAPGKGVWAAASIGRAVGIWYSTDGATWVQSDLTNVKIANIVFANGMWIAGSLSNGLYCSFNGKNWIHCNTPDNSAKPIAAGKDVWVSAVSEHGIFYSEGYSL